MAIFHLEIKKISKQKGQSAKQRFTYISRQAEFKKKHDDLKAIFHFNMPDFSKKQPHDFWACADIYERKNACVAHSMIVSLPREFNLEEQKHLLSDFVEKQFPNQPISIAIHNDHKNKNPHAHLIISGRLIDPYSMQLKPDIFFKRKSKNKKGERTGGAEKVSRDLDPEAVLKIREEWEHQCNIRLQQKGLDLISAKSLKAQGINRAPKTHVPISEFKQIRQISAEIEAMEQELERINAQKPQTVADFHEVQAVLQELDDALIDFLKANNKQNYAVVNLAARNVSRNAHILVTDYENKRQTDRYEDKRQLENRAIFLTRSYANYGTGETWHERLSDIIAKLITVVANCFKQLREEQAKQQRMQQQSQQVTRTLQQPTLKMR